MLMPMEVQEKRKGLKDQPVPPGLVGIDGWEYTTLGFSCSSLIILNEDKWQ